MGSIGDAYDNSAAESFFSTLQCELLDERRWARELGRVHLANALGCVYVCHGKAKCGALAALPRQQR